MRHPVSLCVPVNYKVTLSVRAEGTGILHYQWFTDDEKEVCGLSFSFKKKKERKEIYKYPFSSILSGCEKKVFCV